MGGGGKDGLKPPNSWPPIKMPEYHEMLGYFALPPVEAMFHMPLTAPALKAIGVD